MILKRSLQWLSGQIVKSDSLAFGSHTWSSTHRHAKGGEYRFLTTGILESDRSDVVIYDDAEGTVWVRAKSEFEDGRFEKI